MVVSDASSMLSTDVSHAEGYKSKRTADLPGTFPPFTFVGLDVFGPSQLTILGQGFTMCSRAALIKNIESMEKPSCISSLRRFLHLYCGISFLGTRK